MKRRIAVIALMLVLAGCSQGTETEKVTSSETTSAATTTSPQTTEALPEETRTESSRAEEDVRAERTEADTETAPEEIETALPEEDTDPGLDEEVVESMNEDAQESQGLLESAEDLGLYDIDGGGTDYAFSYGGEEFRAQYTPDNWKIIDSYKIKSEKDMVIICQALSDLHPIHSADGESWRTAEDMAYEWVQHNIAYSVLPDSSQWKANAKDVDLNPEDQGKSIYEMYRDKIGGNTIGRL